MTDSWTVVAIASGYLLLNLAVGWIPGRKQTASPEGYVAGERSLGLLMMYFITGATIFSAFAFLGAPGWAYGRGAAAFYIPAYGTLGFLPFYFLGPRAARLGRKYGFVTQGEMVSRRYGNRGLAIALALCSLVAFIPYLALQMQGAGLVVSAMTRGEVPGAVGAAVVYSVVLIYVMRSGVLGVGWTNTFQGIFMMVMAWGLGLYLPHRLYGGVEAMFRGIAAERPELLTAPGLSGAQAWSWSEYSSAILVSAIGFSFWPHLFMKAFAAKSERTLRRTVVLYPTFQLFLVPILLIGFCGVLFDGPAPRSNNEVLPHMLMNLGLSAVWVGLFCAGALAASMSTGDAIAHAAASILVRDGYTLGLDRPLPPAQERTAVRWVLVGVIVLAYGVSQLFPDQVVGLLLYAFGPVSLLAPTVVCSLYAKRPSGKRVLLGLLLGCAVLLMLQLRPDWRPWPIHAGLFGLATNLAVLSGAWIGAPRELSEDEKIFIRAAEGQRLD